MKRIGLIILFAMPLFGMLYEHPDTYELTDTIEASDLAKFTELLNQKANEHTRLRRKPINLKEAETLARSLLAQKEAATKTLQNRDCYKRIAASIATFGASCLPVGVCTYNALSTGEWISSSTIIAALAAAAAGLYHSGNQLELGISNYDAQVTYSNHLAILKLIEQAKKEAAGESV